MKTSFPKNLALLSTVVFGASFFAYAQLGGAGGVVFAYQGYLERDGTPMNESVDLTVEVYSQANGGAVCDSDVSAGVLVSSGTFGIEVGPIDEDCVLDESVYLEVLVQGTPDGAPVRITGRARVHPTLQAYTGAAGDFDVPDQLSAGSVITGSLGSAAQPVATGAITTVTSTTTNTGRLNATGAGTGLDVTNNATIRGTLNATRAGTGLAVTNNATIGGTLNVGGNVTFANSGCPANTSRVGSWCISANQGASAYDDAIETCNDFAGGPLSVCPFEAMVHCDQETLGSCGALTDAADIDGIGFASSPPILTSTPSFTSDGALGGESAFNRATCYIANWRLGFPLDINVSNRGTPCSSGSAFFCCKTAL